MLEWLRPNPSRWGDLVNLMNKKPYYRKMFETFYEPLRLAYVKETGDLDLVVPAIKEQIKASNSAFISGLEVGVEAARN